MQIPEIIALGSIHGAMKEHFSIMIVKPEEQ